MSTGSSHVGQQTSKHNQQTRTVSFIIMFHYILEDVNEWWSIIFIYFQAIQSWVHLGYVPKFIFRKQLQFGLWCANWTNFRKHDLNYSRKYYRVFLFSSDHYLLIEKKIKQPLWMPCGPHCWITILGCLLIAFFKFSYKLRGYFGS